MTPTRDRYTRLILVILLVSFSLLSLFAIAHKSLTADEHSHLASGFAVWQTGQDILNPEHPPLVKLVAAIPLWTKLRHIPPHEVPGYREADQWNFALSLLYNVDLSIPLDRLVFLGRCLVFFCFGVPLLLSIFFFSRALWGTSGGVFSAILVAFCPNFLAHAPLIHTDIAISLGFVLTTWAAFTFHERPNRRHAIALGLALGFSLAVKFSGVLLVPFVTWVFLRRLSRETWKENTTHLFLITIVSLLLLSLPYGGLFRVGDYTHGLLSVYGNHTDKTYAYYLWGQYRPQGFVFYYPLALLFKTPLPSLCAIIVGCVFAWRRGPKGVHLVFMAAFLPILAGAIARHNIGVRHVFPTLALLYVMAGSVATITPPRSSRLVPYMLSLALIVETVRAYPNFLSHFSIVAGGSRGGVRYLDDSNLDWGLELRNLPAKLAASKITTIKLDYFGLEPYSYRGLQAQPMTVFDRYFPLGDCVVSAHWLIRRPLIPLFQNYAYDWLDQYALHDTVGNALYLYRFRLGERDEFREGIQYLERKSWLQRGIQRLESLVASNPKFYHANLALAEAYTLAGRWPEATAIFTHSSTIPSPDGITPYERVASHLERNGFTSEARMLRKLQPEFTNQPPQNF